MALNFGSSHQEKTADIGHLLTRLQEYLKPKRRKPERGEEQNFTK
jgi:hypothetical protein